MAVIEGEEEARELGAGSGGSHEGAAPTGGYQLGFQMHPLTEDGNLEKSLDGSGVVHSVEHDMLYKMAMENRDGGNKMVQQQQYEQAVGRYSEAIMQLRSLESETDVRWDDAARLKVRELRAAAYLNLSLCFLKTEQWTHAVNTATRALQGDKQVPDPKDDVLPPEKKAKALFRRATAHCEGFGSFDKARDDLKKAHEYAPTDKAIEQMYRKCDVAVKKTSKAADKKMSGFLKKEAASGEGLFDDSLRPSAEEKKPQKPPEPMKVRDGLYLVPEDKSNIQDAKDADVDYEELGREILNIQQDDPQLYSEIKAKVKETIDKMTDDDLETKDDAPPSEVQEASAENAIAGGSPETPAT